MAKRTPAEVYQALVRAGWPPQAARTMTAIAGGESGWRDDAIGDTRLQDSTWGPSYGLFQIRTLKRDTGRGTARDITQLTGDINAQARAAWEISKHGTDFSPWTVYNTGRYRDFVGQVAAALASIPAGVGEVIGDATSAAAGGVLDAIAGALGGLRGIAIEGLAGVVGLGLVAAGLAAAVSPRIRARLGGA